MPIGFDDLVSDVMNDWPATIRVFLDFKMGCVGCPIACFHTVDDACRRCTKPSRQLRRPYAWKSRLSIAQLDLAQVVSGTVGSL